jgi:hypothetical protein
MKVRVSYTVEVNDEFRRAFRLWWSNTMDEPLKKGLASRSEIRELLERYGTLPTDDIKDEFPGAKMWILE